MSRPVLRPGGVNITDLVRARCALPVASALRLLARALSATGLGCLSIVLTTPWCAAQPDLAAPRSEGLTFEGSALPAGCTPEAPKDALYTVTDIYPDHVVLDGNHPLAGIALRLHLKVEAVREATEEEIGRGSTGTGFFKVQTQAPGNDLLH